MIKLNRRSNSYKTVASGNPNAGLRNHSDEDGNRVVIFLHCEKGSRTSWEIEMTPKDALALSESLTRQARHAETDQ